MFDLDSFQEIWSTLAKNKTRSLLTGFGVFWGIFMLVVMLGAGKGLERGMMKNVEGFASNSCFFYASKTSKAYDGFRKGRSWIIRNKDIRILQEKVPEIEYVSPMLMQSGTNNVVRGDRSSTYNVKGLYPEYAKIESQRIKYGRFLNEIDIMHKRKVCVIGTVVYEDLFAKAENPVGKTLKISGIYYTVVGVATGVSNVSIGGRSSQSIDIPFTTMQHISNLGDTVQFLGMTVRKGYTAKFVEDKVKTELKKMNHIAPDDTQAVGSFNIEEQFKMFDNLFLGINILIWIVGLGTLFAGVIGISNIMLVTVRERTKEFGVRRAIGAKPVAILRQVIEESLLLTSVSGIFGLCCGVGLLGLLNMLLESMPSNQDVFFADPIISFWTAVVSMIVLLISGILAGIIPAVRALQIKAIDAIREE